MKYSYAPGSVAAHDLAVAELSAGAEPAAPAYAILRPAQPYDLATPGTPSGIVDVARAADAGALLPAPGGWRHRATFALAADAAGRIVASLCLRLEGDLADRPRRAWVTYVRSEDDDGAVAWRPNGAAMLDAERSPSPKLIGINELKALLRGEVWTPPPPRPGPPKLRCYGCDRVTAYSTTTWRPHTRHRCESTQTEGRS